LGIPIVTLGGAIPTAVGFGLAGACLALARLEKVPAALRIGSSFGLSAVAYAVILILLLRIHKPPRWQANPVAIQPKVQLAENRSAGPVPQTVVKEEEPAAPLPPQLPLVGKIDSFTALATAPEAGTAFLMHNSRFFEHYSYPDFKYLATYKINVPVQKAVLANKHGLLCVAVDEQTIWTEPDRQGT